MFQKKTVFVVGAGASKEFGMPTGDDLRNDIVELTSRTNAIANSGPLGNFRAVLMSSLGPEWTQLQTSGFELAAALPTFVSIDEALHYFSSDERIVRIGKIAVAYLLLKYERSSKIAITRDTGRPNPSNCSETWLAELFSMALSFAKRENVREAFENIHFINFNYDRVIEQYICAALAHLAGLSQEDAEQIAANLNMIRPYGDLGPLAFSRRQGVAFGFEPYAKGGLVQVAEGIRTYTEQMEDPFD